MNDVAYTALGGIIFAALRVVDAVQTLLRVQRPKRGLTDREREVVRPIFGASLPVERIRIVDGRAGLLGISGRAMTMGHTIYLPRSSEQTLVHECVHVWQYRTRRFHYIGNSALHQLASLTFRRSYRPYDWRPGIAAGRAWIQLASVEAQAQFIEDVYAHGSCEANEADRTPGAFFRADDRDHRFVDDGTDLTAAAEEAWTTIRG